MKLDYAAYIEFVEEEAATPTTQDLRRRTEITQVKSSQTRTKPLALTSGRGCYAGGLYTRTDTSVRWEMEMAVVHMVNVLSRSTPP